MSNNTTIVTKFIELLDRQDFPAALELVAPNARVQMGGNHVDREGWRALGTAFYVAFPDGKHTLHRVLESGDFVTVIGTFGGTHKGELMGMPATGRSASVGLVMAYRLAEGRIVEHVGQFDSAGLAQQLTGPAPDLVGKATEWYRRIDATRDMTKVLDMATPTATYCFGSQKLDRDGYVGMGTMFMAAIPDGQHLNDEIVPVGANRVLVKGRFVGTHTGTSLMGIPPAGKKIELGYMSLLTFAADGKVSGLEAQLDSGGLMQQLA